MSCFSVLHNFDIDWLCVFLYDILYVYFGLYMFHCYGRSGAQWCSVVLFILPSQSQWIVQRWILFRIFGCIRNPRVVGRSLKFVTLGKEVPRYTVADVAQVTSNYNPWNHLLTGPCPCSPMRWSLMLLSQCAPVQPPGCAMAVFNTTFWRLGLKSQLGDVHWSTFHWHNCFTSNNLISWGISSDWKRGRLSKLATIQLLQSVIPAVGK